MDELIGEVGTVRETLAPEGLVFVHGEIWRARTSSEEPIPVGTAVEVTGLEGGLVLDVARLEEPAAVADGSHD
jgi:membrane-bound serine protease (ClpP class)